MFNMCSTYVEHMVIMRWQCNGIPIKMSEKYRHKKTVKNTHIVPKTVIVDG